MKSRSWEVIRIAQNVLWPPAENRRYCQWQKERTKKLLWKETDWKATQQLQTVSTKIQSSVCCFQTERICCRCIMQSIETSYTDAAQLEIVTLENVMYMGMKNDLAFIIIRICFCMNISLRITRTCLWETYSTFPANIRKWWIGSPCIPQQDWEYPHRILSYFIMEQRKKKIGG